MPIITSFAYERLYSHIDTRMKSLGASTEVIKKKKKKRKNGRKKEGNKNKRIKVKKKKKERREEKWNRKGKQKRSDNIIP